MEIKFKNVKIKNFFSIGQAELTLSDNGYVFIKGINNFVEDNARANGTGKCFGKGTKVLMYDGTEKNVEDIKVNDIVMGWDFTPRVVIETHTGTSELFEIKSSRGDSYRYVCNGEHLLCLTNTCGEHIRYKIGEKLVMSVNDYVKSGCSVKRYLNQTIPGLPCTFYQSPMQKMLIPPYILGLWLGDGTSHSSTITTMDKEIVGSIENYAINNDLHVNRAHYNSGKAYTYNISANSSRAGNQFWKAIRYYDLEGNKHIPLEYLTADIDSRFQLLAGLIDTDGSVANNRWYEITLKRNQLSYDVVRLARSLGFRVLVSIKNSYTHKGVKSYYDRILISGNVWEVPVKLPRKQIQPYHVQHYKTLHPTVTSLGNGEFYGFQITGDGQFLLSDYTIVHNSSVMDSIIWNLTGETSRGTKDVVNKYSQGGTKVELEFDIDNDHYKVTRCKEDSEFGTNLFIYKNNENKSGKGIRDTEKILQEYLPDLNAQLLGSVIILGQGLPQRFTNNTPSGRKEVLEKLSKSDFMIADIKDRLSKRKTQLQEQLRMIEDSILSDNSKKSVLENNLQKLKNDKALLEQTDINAIKQDIIATQNHVVEVMKSKEIFELQQSSLQEKVNKALDDYTNFNKTLDATYNSEYAHLEENCKILDIKNHLADLEFEKKQREVEMTRLESIRDVCPTCGQKLPDVHKVDTTQLHKEYDEFMVTYNNIKNDYAETTEKLKQDALKLKESLYKGLDELKAEGQVLRKQLNESIDEVQKHNQELNNSQLRLDKLKLNKENYEKQITSIDKDLLICESDIKDLNEKILYNNIEKDSLNKHLEINTKMTTIATRDFRGKLLSNIIEFIEAQAKTYCRDIFDTEEIEFKLDGNNIYIGYLNKSYEALSGGEKQKVDLIVQFSIRDMLSQFLGFTSNILVLDEVFDNLDGFGCQKVIDLITNRFNDVESIFIISHHTELSIPYDKEIVVIKNEKGISSIEC